MRSRISNALCTIVVGFLYASVAHAQAYDNSAVGIGATGGATINYTTGGTNRIICAMFSFRVGGDDPTTHTVDGVAMTQFADFFSGQRVYLYCLTNPASGSVSVVLDDNTSPGHVMDYLLFSYKGVKQTGQPEVVSTFTSLSGTTSTESITTITNNANAVLGTTICSACTFTAGSGVTSRGGSGGYFLGDSNGSITPAASYSMTWGDTTFGDYAILLSFAPVSGAIPTVHPCILGLGIICDTEDR